MFSLLCNFVFVVFLSCWALGADDCELSCEIDGEKYLSSACRKDCETNPECSFKLIPMTARIRDTIQMRHNSARVVFSTKGMFNSTIGTASNMEAMKYNMDLEHAAQCNEEMHNCRVEHDKCRITEKYKSVGQNIKIITTEEIVELTKYRTLASDIITKWSLQMHYFIKSPDLSGAPPEIKQMLNAETNQVGCGMFTADYKFVLICNYAPAFLETQTELFKKGTPCSDCPETTHCKSNGLCAENLNGAISSTSSYQTQKNSENNEEQTDYFTPSTDITSIYGNENMSNRSDFKRRRYFKRNRNGATETKASVVLMNFSLAIVCSMKAFFVLHDVHL